MNIESSAINLKNTQQANFSSNQANSSVKFEEELNTLKEPSETPVDEQIQESESVKTIEVQDKENELEQKTDTEDGLKKDSNENSENLSYDKAIEGLNQIVNELNQSEDKIGGIIKNDKDLTDKNTMINNDFNIQDNKDLLPQMNPNMNFSGDGQPFSSFMNNQENGNHSKNGGLTLNSKDLAEESAILSTMAENIAMANRNNLNVNLDQNNVKIMNNEDGIKKVEKDSGITIETVVKYDTVVMNQADVEFFVELVQKGEINVNNLTPKSIEKSVQVSKTLADMIAKSMSTNQPVRIEFDNDISVIIRISKDGKISADFLPSSQVAEAYLKENLPLLKQRFEDNNIEYDELNHRNHKEREKEENKKKGRNNE